MSNQNMLNAHPARRRTALFVALLAAGFVRPCWGQLEPLPSISSSYSAPPQSFDPLSPTSLAPTSPTLPTPENEVWTPYGNGSVEPPNDMDYEPCYDCVPTGFEGSDGPWEFQVMPKSLIWHSYLAGPWEPRFASVWSNEKNEGWVWDVALGGRVSLCRYGTKDCAQPSGWELQMEGAAFPRLDPEEQVDVMATDYRFGMPIVYGNGPYQMKIGIYHISSHLGDEYMISNPTVERINFGRNAIAWGHSYYATPDLRLYGEIDWASDSMYSEPWYFQFGFDYAPILRAGNQCAPFVAVNCQLREELDFSGQFVVQAGWAWRYGADRRMFRVGLQYYNGGNQQFEFYTDNEQKAGFGLWYDY